jgi:thiamine-monophosphate kinase
VRAFAQHHPWSSSLLDAYLRPQARVEAGRALLGLASALIDISDGWRSDLAHLCEASRVRARLDHALPRSQAMEEASRYLSRPIETWLFGPSDDYELLFTVPGDRWVEADRALAGRGVRVTRIGSIIEGDPGLDADRPGHATEPGWDHFRQD